VYKAGTCAAQTLNVLWSSYLTEGGLQLLQPTPANPNVLYRLCGLGALTPVKQFPDDNTQLKKMIYPDKQAGTDPTEPLLMPPQVVADVQYTFTPTFPLLGKNVTFTFYASATFPAPLGDDDQYVGFDNSAGGNAVEVCPALTPP
jgi:hypothetical protein